MDNKKAALYLFCFARSGAVGAVQATGVDGQSAIAILQQSPDLCAVVGEVAQEDFCGPAAEGHMQQLDWVAPRALRHEAVIEEVMASSPVLPVPFGTLFSSPEALTEFVEQHRETITAFLRRVADHGEWSVKGLFDRKQAQKSLPSERMAAQQNQLSAMPPGMRHFAEVRISRDTERELRLRLDHLSRTVASGLISCAADFRECETSSQAPSESGLEEVLNWAFLLTDSAIAQFRVEVDQANRDYESQGLLLRLSGPWPPYRFVPALSAAAAP
jgi:hypothetical protein